MSDAHVADELPRLLSGDASRAAVHAAAAHLRGCADCQQELVAAVTAHAALTSARRFAAEVVAEAVAHPADDPADGPGEAPPPEVLPELGPVLERARAEAARGAGRSRRRVLAIAAAVVVLAGAGTGIGLAVSGSGAGSAARQVALAPYAEGRQPASVRMVGGDRMEIDATALPRLTDGRRYEVWLTDARRTRMAAVGFIAPDNTADLTVPGTLLARFSDVEVSVQNVEQAGYSGVSVLRGSYR